MAEGVLVVVSTPIGNLGDLSPRAADELRGADLVLAEDTRRTATLLRHVEASTPMRAHHQHNEAASTAEVLPRLRAGERVVLVSDAGTPLVSDPGQRLVAAAADQGIRVEAVPGPSAPLHALVVSGLPAERFAFEGFLPRRGRERDEALAVAAAEQRTTVWFVAPHRADTDLADLAAVCGADRRAALCRELTKRHEEVVRATLGELAAITADEQPRGEVTLVVAGAPPVEHAQPSTADLVAAVQSMVDDGMRAKDAAGVVADSFDLRKNEVFEIWLTGR